jgi:hypothetical protein
MSAGISPGHAQNKALKTSDLTSCGPGTALALSLVHGSNEPMTAPTKETCMNTQITSKLAAFAAALMMSTLIMGGVAYLLEGRIQQPSLSVAIAGVTSPSAHGAA